MKKFIAVLAIAAFASAVNAQQNVSINDGVVTLNGEFKQLAGIETVSAGGKLSLASVNIPNVGDIDLTAPFTGGTVVAKEAGTVVLGVLGADKRIDIEGATATSIMYDGDNAAAQGDLTVNLGLGDAAPAAFPVVPEPATGLMAAFGLVGLLGLRRRR